MVAAHHHRSDLTLAHHPVELPGEIRKFALIILCWHALGQSAGVNDGAGGSGDRVVRRRPFEVARSRIRKNLALWFPAKLQF